MKTINTMEENLKREAWELVNEIYQPLGHLRCMVSTDEMWEYAKARALEQVNRLLMVIPEYPGQHNPALKKWDGIKAEIQKMH